MPVIFGFCRVFRGIRFGLDVFSAVSNERGLISRAQGYQSILQRGSDSIKQSSLPGRNDVGWIQWDGIELVGLVNPELMAGALDVIPFAIDAEILDQQAILQTEVRIPDFKFAGIHDGRRLFVDEGDAAVRQ